MLGLGRAERYASNWKLAARAPLAPRARRSSVAHHLAAEAQRTETQTDPLPRPGRGASQHIVYTSPSSRLRGGTHLRVERRSGAGGRSPRLFSQPPLVATTRASPRPSASSSASLGCAPTSGCSPIQIVGSAYPPDSLNSARSASIRSSVFGSATHAR